MKTDEILKKLTYIAKNVFDNEEVVLNGKTTASDVEGWDSLSHIQFVVAIEKNFKIKFTSREIQSWKNIGDIVSDLIKRNVDDIEFN